MSECTCSFLLVLNVNVKCLKHVNTSFGTLHVLFCHIYSINIESLLSFFRVSQTYDSYLKPRSRTDKCHSNSLDLIPYFRAKETKQKLSMYEGELTTVWIP